MKPARFEYHVPATTADALQLLADHGDDAKVLAGGQSLVPILALRLARFDHLVDLNEVPELAGIARDGDSVVVGAMTRQRAVERSSDIAVAVPLLARATPLIGHFQIRNRGTVGGSLAHADPASEYPAVAVALGAELEIASAARGVRRVAATDFFEGTWTTALAPDELLVAARFPVWGSGAGFAIEEFARRHGDFAVAGVACALTQSPGGSVQRAGIALFGVSSTPIRAVDAEAALADGASPTEAAEIAIREIAPVDDVHASATTRRRITRHLVEVAIARAQADATAPSEGLAASRASVTGHPRPTDAVPRPTGAAPTPIAVTVNDERRHAIVEPRRTLADFLREDCALTGTHLGCEHGVCGACTVLVDGEAVRSCLVFAVQAHGHEVTTVEGVGGPDGALSPVQDAFREEHGLQCGFCTPGFVVSVTALLRDTPVVSEADVRAALSGNLCRCTGYQGIVRAVQRAAAAEQPA